MLLPDEMDKCTEIERSLFSEVPRGDILGLLHVQVPFVSVKGTSHVKQFLQETKSLDIFK